MELNAMKVSQALMYPPPFDCKGWPCYPVSVTPTPSPKPPTRLILQNPKSLAPEYVKGLEM